MASTYVPCWQPPRNEGLMIQYSTTPMPMYLRIDAPTGIFYLNASLLVPSLQTLYFTFYGKLSIHKSLIGKSGHWRPCAFDTDVDVHINTSPILFNSPPQFYEFEFFNTSISNRIVPRHQPLMVFYLQDSVYE